MGVFDIIQELNIKNGRLYKESILEKYRDHILFRQVLSLTYDMKYNFFIKKIPTYNGGDFLDSGNKISLELAIPKLGVLYNREKTGNAAILFLQDLLNSLSSNDADILTKIISRDLRCGVNIKTINKIFGKNFISESPYMRCSLLDDKTIKNIKFPAISEMKMDGMFVNAILDTVKGIYLTSRSGKFIENIPEDSNILKDLEKINEFHTNFVFQGEIVSRDNDGNILPREVGNGIMNKKTMSAKEANNLYFIVWDIIPLNEFYAGKGTIKRKERFEFSKNLIENFNGIDNIKFVDYMIVNNLQEAYKHYFDITKSGGEGTILKDLDGYFENKTSKKQLKLKVEFDVDLRVVKYNPGSGKYKELFGSLQCESEDGKLTVNISGFSDSLRKSLFDRQDELIGKYISVTANDVLIDDNGFASLYLPRFNELRLDKNEGDTLERIIQQKEMVINLKSQKV
jgi:ATP-dependent DNA ligase